MLSLGGLVKTMQSKDTAIAAGVKRLVKVNMGVLIAVVGQDGNGYVASLPRVQHHGLLLCHAAQVPKCPVMIAKAPPTSKCLPPGCVVPKQTASPLGVDAWRVGEHSVVVNCVPSVPRPLR